MDFKANIEELIKQGHSFTDIAEQFDTAMNQAMADTGKDDTVIDAEREQACNVIDAAIDLDSFSKDAVVAAAVCWAIDNHEDWGEDEIQLIKEAVPSMLDILSGTIEVVKPLLEQEVKKFDGETCTACTSCGCEDKDTRKSDMLSIQDFLKALR